MRSALAIQEVLVTPNLEDFIAFLASKPADDEYPYDDAPETCALGEYLGSLGTSWEAQRPTMGSTFNMWLGFIASPLPRTYGAAHARAVEFALDDE